MTHVKTSPYYPQSNGKIERWHKTLKGECIRVKVPLSVDDARRLVHEFVTHYNHTRLHSAIDYVAPKAKLDGRDRDILQQRDQKLAQARERRRQMRQAQQGQCQSTVTPRPAIDLDAVRSVLNIGDVLDLLGFQPRSRRGPQLRGPCPLHGSTRGTSRCFSVHLQRHAFHCFKCGRHGNALDLWSHATGQTPYDAALDLFQRLNLPLPTLSQPLMAPPRNREEEPVAPLPNTCTMEST